MKVMLLAGGRSNEREVSLTSGAAVYGALERLGHTPIAVDPSTGNRLAWQSNKLVADRTSDVSGSTELTAVQPESLLATLGDLGREAEVAFIALHGGGGENGSIQNLLDLAGMKYTGSGMAASAVCMNKALTKRVMASLEVSTPDWQLYHYHKSRPLSAIAAEIKHRFTPPLIIKPNDGGSTIGLTKLDDTDGIEPALERSVAESPDILAEKYIPGRELTVTVLDGRAYPVVEIKPRSGLYDYEAKYTKGKSEYIAPAKIAGEVSAMMQRAATRLYEAIGCRGLVRVDFIMDPSGAFYCLEVNTLPGMTELSLAPMALGCEGYSFDDMIRMMLDSALGD